MVCTGRQQSEGTVDISVSSHSRQRGMPVRLCAGDSLFAYL